MFFFFVFRNEEDEPPAYETLSFKVLVYDSSVQEYLRVNFETYDRILIRGYICYKIYRIDDETTQQSAVIIANQIRKDE